MFVTGCHRSGTSVVASLICSVLGSNLSSSKQLPPALDNPGGFHESTDFVEANDCLLACLGASWDHPPLFPVNWRSAEVWPEVMALRERLNKRALNRCWVEKDPRLAITATAYHHIFLRRPGLIVVLREPYGVAQSLFARNGISINASLCLWWIYNLHLSSMIQSGDVLLFYDELCHGSLSEDIVNNLSDFLAMQTALDINVDMIRASLSKVVRPEWRRSSSDVDQPAKLFRDSIDSDLLSICQETYLSLKTSPLIDLSDNYVHKFSCLPSQIFSSLVANGWTGWPPGHRYPQDVQVEIQLQSIQRTRSWQIIQPVRSLVNQLRWFPKE